MGCDAVLRRKMAKLTPFCIGAPGGRTGLPQPPPMGVSRQADNHL